MTGRLPSRSGKECATTKPSRKEYFVSVPKVVDTKANYGIPDCDSRWQVSLMCYCGKPDLPLLEGIPGERALAIMNRLNYSSILLSAFEYLVKMLRRRDVQTTGESAPHKS